MYGLIDQADSVHYIKITRAFIGPGNSLEYAQIPDSNYFKTVNATITEKINGNTGRTWTLFDTTILNKDQKPFHLIISDLELLDKDGFYQEVQGVEIYDAVLKSESSVIGIVTGLGRKGIVKLLKIEESLILPKKNLRKFDVDVEIDGLIKNLLFKKL